MGEGRSVARAGRGTHNGGAETGEEGTSAVLGDDGAGGVEHTLGTAGEHQWRVSDAAKTWPGEVDEVGREGPAFPTRARRGRTLLYVWGSSWMVVLTTSMGVAAPWVTAQPMAPARAKLRGEQKKGRDGQPSAGASAGREIGRRRRKLRPGRKAPGRRPAGKSEAPLLAIARRASRAPRRDETGAGRPEPGSPPDGSQGWERGEGDAPGVEVGARGLLAGDLEGLGLGLLALELDGRGGLLNLLGDGGDAERGRGKEGRHAVDHCGGWKGRGWRGKGRERAGRDGVVARGRAGRAACAWRRAARRAAATGIRRRVDKAVRCRRPANTADARPAVDILRARVHRIRGRGGGSVQGGTAGRPTLLRLEDLSFVALQGRPRDLRPARLSQHSTRRARSVDPRPLEVAQVVGLGAAGKRREAAAGMRGAAARRG